MDGENIGVIVVEDRRVEVEVGESKVEVRDEGVVIVIPVHDLWMILMHVVIDLDPFFYMKNKSWKRGLVE